MTERKPNNLPWVILGGVCGLVLLGLFGAGVYSGAKAVSDEMTITLPEPPEMVAQSKLDSVFTLYVDETNNIFLDGEAVDNMAALKVVLESMDPDNLKSTRFILRLSEKSSHKGLITIKDMLDAFEAKSVIEIIRSEAE